MDVWVWMVMECGHEVSGAGCGLGLSFFWVDCHHGVEHNTADDQWPFLDRLDRYVSCEEALLLVLALLGLGDVLEDLALFLFGVDHLRVDLSDFVAGLGSRMGYLHVVDGVDLEVVLV